MKKMMVLVMVLGLASMTQGALLYDHFDNGVLDPAWTVSGNNSGYTGTESGTNYTISKINWQGWDNTPTVSLSQNLSTPLASDFQVNFDISWAMTEWRAIEGLGIKLLDSAGSLIAGVGMSDSWGSNGPGVGWSIGSSSGHTGQDALPLAGNANFLITRQNGAVSIFNGGNPVMTGLATNAISKVEIEFYSYYYWTPGFSSPESAETGYGPQSVDRVNVVPEPATLTLLGLSAVGLLRRRS